MKVVLILSLALVLMASASFAAPSRVILPAYASEDTNTKRKELYEGFFEWKRSLPADSDRSFLAYQHLLQQRELPAEQKGGPETPLAVEEQKRESYVEESVREPPFLHDDTLQEIVSLVSAFGFSKEELQALHQLWKFNVPIGKDNSFDTFLGWLKEQGYPEDTFETDQRSGVKRSMTEINDWIGSNDKKEYVADEQPVAQVQKSVDEEQPQVQQFVDEEQPQEQQFVDEEQPQVQQFVDEEQQQLQQFVDEEEPQVQQFVDEEQQQLQQFADEEEPQVQRFVDEEEPQVQQFVDEEQQQLQQFAYEEEPQVQRFVDEEEPQVQQFADEEQPQMQQFVDEEQPQGQQFVDEEQQQLQQFVDEEEPQVQQFVEQSFEEEQRQIDRQQVATAYEDEELVGENREWESPEDIAIDAERREDEEQEELEQAAFVDAQQQEGISPVQFVEAQPQERLAPVPVEEAESEEYPTPVPFLETEPNDTNGGYSCEANSPCNIENISNEQFYFATTSPDKFIQCDAWGGCHTLSCDDGLVWDDQIKTCGPST